MNLISKTNFLLTLFIICIPDAAFADPLGLPKHGQDAMIQFAKDHCLRCHGPEKQKGHFRIDQLAWQPNNTEQLTKWVELLDNVSFNEMPPDDEPQPSTAEKQRFEAILEQWFSSIDAHAPRPPLRRLTRQQYRNTIADLLKLPDTHVDPSRDFLRDNNIDGLQTISEVLDMSDFRMRSYLQAAKSIIDAVDIPEHQPVSTKKTLDLKLIQGCITGDVDRPAVLWFDRLATPTAPLMWSHEVTPVKKKRSRKKIGQPLYTHPGTYRIHLKVEAKGLLDDGTPHYQEKYRSDHGDLVLGINITSLPGATSATDQRVAHFELPQNKIIEISQDIYVPKNQCLSLSFPEAQVSNIKRFIGFSVAATLPNLKRDPKTGKKVISAKKIRRLFYSANPEGKIAYLNQWNVPRILIHSIDIEGPLYADWPPQSHVALYGEPSRSDEQIIRSFAVKTFRHPVSDELLEPFFQHAQTGATGLKGALRAMLCSPHFLYLRENNDELDAYQLASRLSYFLWSSMPDERLFKLARSGDLKNPDVLRGEVDRMIADSKFERFIADFTWQWLGLENSKTMPAKLPNMDMRTLFTETQLFFHHLIKHDLPIAHLIDSDYTFANSKLAQYYGLDDRPGRLTFSKVSLQDCPERGGLLGQASVLSASTNGVETSPVTRGVWVLTHFMDSKPPPPPPNIEFPAVDTTGANTVRQILEQHRSDPNCAQCHQAFDPIGFALEGYGIDGLTRTRYPKNQGKGNIDTSGQLSSGIKFEDFQSFKDALKSREQIIFKALATKLIEYGTGRKLHPKDHSDLLRLLLQQQGGLRSLLHSIVQSSPFTGKPRANASAE